MKLKESEQLAFELKLKDQEDWPCGFVEYVRSVVKVEKWTFRETAHGLHVTLPPAALPCFQGWLELRGLTSAEEQRFA
jgi:hypothetical protein